MDCSLPGISVHGIFQARILEWVAISYSRGSSWPKDRTHISCASYTGRWILYHCSAWEAQILLAPSKLHMFKGNGLKKKKTSIQRSFITTFFLSSPGSYPWTKLGAPKLEGNSFFRYKVRTDYFQYPFYFFNLLKFLEAEKSTRQLSHFSESTRTQSWSRMQIKIIRWLFPGARCYRQGLLHGCVTSAITLTCAYKNPLLGLMLYSCHLEIINNF